MCLVFFHILYYIIIELRDSYEKNCQHCIHNTISFVYFFLVMIYSFLQFKDSPLKDQFLKNIANTSSGIGNQYKCSCNALINPAEKSLQHIIYSYFSSSSPLE